MKTRAFQNSRVRARNSTAYYSCDDHFVIVDKAVDCGNREASLILSQASSGLKSKKQLRINSSSCLQGTDLKIKILSLSFFILAVVFAFLLNYR
ncbi:hypothetical protein IEQ34_022164 [Dendrobium chrysotoxum]|uniref:Transmembrane protein n=1 Tax=Dendrobium chrysotoxum TaxID=161865 RepID=A0AAV7FK17_DENCH|nr:hypothetical protein IEQ34_022164 [Dendrobium chrysotoxum]